MARLCRLPSEEAPHPVASRCEGHTLCKAEDDISLVHTWRPFDFYFPKGSPLVPWGNPEPTERQARSPESTVPVCAGLATSEVSGRWGGGGTHISVPSHVPLVMRVRPRGWALSPREL